MEEPPVVRLGFDREEHADNEKQRDKRRYCGKVQGMFGLSLFAPSRLCFIREQKNEKCEKKRQSRALHLIFLNKQEDKDAEGGEDAHISGKPREAAEAGEHKAAC